ncbi:cytochrome P450 [Hyalangium versicolor]|uniref:cytochrome P450 n=1 Tax=Hyalangium versicolor TaxID=2861190 RepID=UPI001CCE203C|nr:cytochrome P450 [Hyalangium versicolor]
MPSGRPNLSLPEVRQNPYPLYAQLRREAPVCELEPAGWAISRYEDVAHVLKNPRVFSSEGLRFAVEPPWFGRSNPWTDSLVMKDPPHHARLRTLVSRAFGSSLVSRLEPSIRATCETITSRILERREVDFVQDFALPLPASVIGGLMGLDPSLQSRFKKWAEDIVALSVSRPEDTELLASARTTVEEMERYFNEVMDHRRREPGEDMVSDLLRARVDGEPLTNRELMGFLFFLLLAGLETTGNLLSTSTWILSREPELLARLRADRSLIPRFLEEVLRYEPPVQATLRLCTEDTTVGGVPLPKGAMMYVLLASALRDENHFPDAERFDLDRTEPENLAFGHGIHFCLGAQLARVEARLALETMLTRIGRLSLRAEQVEWLPGVTVRGLKALPLEVRS